MKKTHFIGIDLAGQEKNPTGWALLQNKYVITMHLFTDDEILNKTLVATPTLVAIDAPLTLPEKGSTRKVDREMCNKGYPVFPALFPSMKKLTFRAISLYRRLRDEGVNVIEVHPTSTRRALQIPTKNWRRIQELFLKIGFRGDLERKTLTQHEIDAISAALTAHLHLKGKTKSVGDEKGYIIIPVNESWKRVLV